MVDSISRLKHLTRRDAGVTTIVAIMITGMAMMMVIGMGFQPGWANGWPLGISKHVVFASFVTIVFAVVSISGASALFVWLGVFAERVANRSFVGWLTFLFLLVLAAASVLFACPHVYSVIHAEIVQEWQ